MNRRPLSAAPARKLLACSLMVASGFAGLAYQIVWTQQSTLWLGHESAAVLAVVAAFFGGLAVGALSLSRFIEHAPRPARWYAGCELVIGMWSLVLAVLLEPLSGVLLGLIGPQPSPLRHWTISFCGTFLALLPATAAMGATLPAMERMLAGMEDRSTISALYAANTLGAVLGVLGAAFWLVPQFGLIRTASVCALLNLACAAIALRVGSGKEDFGDKAQPRSRPAPGSRVLLLLAATGLLGIGYEVLVVRALSQVAENTVYTFAILLAVYLIGTTLGAAAYARWLAGRYEPEMLRDRLLQMLGAACLAGTLLLSRAENLKAALMESFGSGMSAALIVETVLAGAAFLLPTVLMGALFSHLSTSAREVGVAFGRAVGLNTLGAAFAPLLFNVFLLPLWGLKLVLISVAAGYLVLTSLHRWLKVEQWGLITATITCLVWMPSLQLVTLTEGSRLVTHLEGVMASVSVVEDAEGNATLHIDNRQQEGSSATLFADARQALLPILLHPAPRRALFLGVGTGLTAWSATLDPALHVDAVELVPEVVAATTYFTAALPSWTDSSRLRLISADARRFVRTSDEQYDVIVSDNFHPARSGSGSLYTIEHFASVQYRLAQGGLFCQWLPLHQLDLTTLRSIVRSFLAVYPDGAALLATNSLDTPVVGLIARRNGERFNIQHLRERLKRIPAQIREDFGVADELAIAGSFVADSRALSQFAAHAALNTDDHPFVAYEAPRVTYAPGTLPRDRLLMLLRELTVHPDEVFPIPDSGAPDAEWNARLAAYWAARNRFIEAGRDVRVTSDVREMLAQVRGPLLSVLQLSPDFRPAYDPLLRMASALSDVDPVEARALLSALQGVQPSRSEAGQKLRELSAK